MIENQARFNTNEEARAAADKAMPRRKHRRPYPTFSGALNCWTVYAPNNTVLLNTGEMFNYVTGKIIRA